MSDFSVESVNLCDFVTSDASGKAILIGVYQGNIRFGEPPLSWPALFFNVVLRPRSVHFGFSVKFVRPNGVNFIDLSGEYSAPDFPPPENRAVINFQIPPMRFTGPGDYLIVIADSNGQELYRDTIPVAIGAIPSFAASLNANISVNAEL